MFPVILRKSDALIRFVLDTFKPPKKSDSSTVIIIVVVILIILVVIAAIFAYRFRSRIRLCCRRILENNNGPKAAKKQKKANFHVQMEATYSEVKTGLFLVVLLPIFTVKLVAPSVKLT